MPLTDIATVTVEAAWANNPDDASPTWYTVPSVEQVQIGSRGRHYELDTVNPTRATIRIDNTEGLYSSGDIVSGGTVAPDRPIRVRAAVPVTSTTTTTPRKGSFAGQSFAAGPLGSFIAITTSSTSTVTSTYTLAKHTIESAPSRLDSGGFDYASSTFTTIDFLDALASRTLMSAYNEHTLYEQPTAYYPLSQTAGSTTAIDIVGGLSATITPVFDNANNGLPAAAFGATPFFGVQDTSTTLSLAPHFTGGAVDAGQTIILGKNGVGTYITGSTWAVRLTFATTYSDASGYLFYQSNRASGVDNEFSVNIGSFGLLAFMWPGLGSPWGPSTAYNDGYAHTIQIVGNSTNTRVFIDGVLMYTGAVATGLNRSGYLTVGSAINLTNQLANSYGYHGQIGHIAVWNGSAPTDVYWHGKAIKGFAGETAWERIDRLMVWSNYSSDAFYDYDTSTVLGPMNCSGQTVMQQCMDTAAAEDGMFYIGADGKPRLRSRASRYKIESVATFGSTTYPIESSQLEFAYDRQHLINDLQVSRPDGPTYRLTNQTSITAHRRRTGNVTIAVTSDDQLVQAGNWYLYRYSNPILRVGTISLRPFTTPGLATLACTLEPGDKITVNNLPTQAPASSMDFIIESIAHANITNDDWTVELSLSPWIAAVTIDETSHYGYIDDYLTNTTSYGVLIY